MARSSNVLQYNAGPVSRATVRRQYLRLRSELGTPPRCDNPQCRFHRASLVWNKELLPLILDHKNGNSHDNRPENLRLLCANCDSQLVTRGGRNKGRVRLSEGGFGLRDAEGKFHYVLLAEAGHYRVSGGGRRRRKATKKKANRVTKKKRTVKRREKAKKKARKKTKKER